MLGSEEEELKRLLEENLALTQETNHLVHKMRRSAIWGRVFQIVWWVIVFVVAGGAYYYYAQPYVNAIEKWYGNAQAGSTQTQSFGSQIENFLRNLTPPASH